jgi:CheY-like chemotaxis protein
VVLVVEDERLIQETLENALSPAVSRLSGEDAVALLQGDSSKYRALSTDINLLGEMDGWQVAHRARELNPEIPVIYMTGAAAADWSANGRAQKYSVE